jgi:hypothetical protein
VAVAINTWEAESRIRDQPGQQSKKDPVLKKNKKPLLIKNLVGWILPPTLLSDRS